MIMKNMNKLLKISIILLIIISIIGIFNFYVVPPKCSKEAVKHKVDKNNLLGLKSITVDEDKIIYEFSSRNKYFNYVYIKHNQKDNNSQYYCELFDIIDNKKIGYYSENYKIISSLTSNYFIVYKDGQDKTDSIKCTYTGDKKDNFFYVHIIINGYENPGITKSYDLIDENTTVWERQKYNSTTKEWDEIEKSTSYYYDLL